jgi:hypothetical protein
MVPPPKRRIRDGHPISTKAFSIGQMIEDEDDDEDERLALPYRLLCDAGKRAGATSVLVDATSPSRLLKRPREGPSLAGFAGLARPEQKKGLPLHQRRQIQYAHNVGIGIFHG